MDTEEDFPLVSAILLAGRASITDTLKAIHCFTQQTYKQKELIIVNNAKNHFDATALNIQAQKDIFLIDTPYPLSAGMARNYGISAANGQILAQFDPDYWYAPNRIESQIATIAANEVHVAILSETLAYSYISGRASYQTNDRKAILNTMVFVRPSNIDYPNTEKQEELGLLLKMQEAGMQIISMPSPELACKIYPSNESPKPQNCGLLSSHFKIIKKMIKQRSN